MPWRRGKKVPPAKAQPEVLDEELYVDEEYFDDEFEPATTPIPAGRAARRRQAERERSYEGGHHRSD